MVLEQTDYNDQFANVFSKSRTASSFYACDIYSVLISILPLLCEFFFLNKHRHKNKMIFFSKEHKRLFHGPLSEEKHPLSDVILSRYHNLGNPDCSFPG